MDRSWVVRRQFGLLLAVAALATSGCQTVKTPEEKIAKSNIPRELNKTALPEYVVEPPDIIIVEVLEALPGRPISGERLVRPDGTISLGFYGEVFVAGQTLTEIKEKIVIHLRKYINDEVLGLVKGQLPTNPDDPIDENAKPIPVPPRETDRVFVDCVSFNSKVYYVWGDVAVPGRLPITGNETVLDAISYSGGLIPTASTVNIRLVRPAPPGACCEQTLPVNYAAIINAGDVTTNYQLMPGDRLVVYRDPIVRTSVFLDRLASPFNSVLNSMFQYSITARAVKAINVPINPTGSTSGTTIGRGVSNGVTTPATNNSLSRGAQ